MLASITAYNEYLNSSESNFLIPYLVILKANFSDSFPNIEIFDIEYQLAHKRDLCYAQTMYVLYYDDIEELLNLQNTQNHFCYKKIPNN